MLEQQLAVGTGRCRFGVFEFDVEAMELSKSGRRLAVRPQPLKLLALLLARPGELVSRDDLQRALWNDDTFVDFEQGVNHAIRELRAALELNHLGSCRLCPGADTGSWRLSSAS
jgi:DNA-binding winged helix-turn-helix (wHTH) protein